MSLAAEAPGAPGAPQTWASADKHGFGTAHDRSSRVWFTLRAAELTEVFYPDLGTPSLRDLEFAVTDGRSFVDFETSPRVDSRVTPLDGSLAYRQTTQTKRWKLTKTWLSHPDYAAVLGDVRFRSETGKPLDLYLLADPAPGDDGDDDRATAAGRTLVAGDDTVATAIAARPELGHTTSGYRATKSDPQRALRRAYGLGRRLDANERGNVVQAARTKLDGTAGARKMTLSIGFGPRPVRAAREVRASLAERFTRVERRYAAGWGDYLDTLKDPPASVASDPELLRLYEQSVMVLEASEDKRYRGASVASPSMPWVWGTLTLEDREDSGPYHLVWPRDLYHVAITKLVAGNERAPQRMLDYLWRVQKPNGSYWQNTEVDGTERWTRTQLDEVALPIVLAWQLGRTAKADWKHVRKAADYVVRKGPWTPQERWENQRGWSPNTIASEIAGLVCAAAIARANGDEARAATYEATADEWEAKVEAWTATTSPVFHSPVPHYLRFTPDGNPDDGTQFDLGDNFPRELDEREVLDPSFLDLVLFGVKPHDDPTILNSLEVVDQTLRVDGPAGPLWYRFTHDGYGEQTDGEQWEVFDTAERQTLGRLWPLLSGERGEYELLAGRDATTHLRTIAATANNGLMLPEQVWDGRPPTGEPGFEFGEGTRSATPLAWTHAQFIRLAWSIDAGEPVERPAIVACRYLGEDC